MRELAGQRHRGKESPGLEGEPQAAQKGGHMGECWAGVQCSVPREQPQLTGKFSAIVTGTPPFVANRHRWQEAALPSSWPPLRPAGAAPGVCRVCLCMPTHHYSRIAIRTQFLGQELAALLVACSQQIALEGDLLVGQGEGKCCKEAGGEAAPRPGMSLESHSPGPATYSRARSFTLWSPVSSTPSNPAPGSA